MDEINNLFRVDLEEFDDGHSPGGTEVSTKIAVYSNKNTTNFLTVFDNLLPSEWCDRAYEYALKKGHPWGAYITTEEARQATVYDDAEQLWATGQFEKAISLIAVRRLIVERGGPIVGKDLSILHGTAVWCLASSAKDEVKYHVDYAELYRYETNIIYPPVYAGTCHVSPLRNSDDINGGAFKANLDGLSHYKKFGYKCRLLPEEEFQCDLKSSQWLTIPYMYNRGILHDGDYPHYSTEVESIKEGYKRVILGFNAFTKEVSECNMRAPEHSDAFNRTIKLYQKMAAFGLSATNIDGLDSKYSSKGDKPPAEKANSVTALSEADVKVELPKKAAKKGINIEDIKKNPMLAKLLITAAKKKKEEETKVDSIK